MKKWVVRPFKSEQAKQANILQNNSNFSPLCCKLLAARGLDSVEKVSSFLQLDGQLSDPFLIKDMDKAVALISEAIENEKPIAIFGDYDCDGIVSTAMLYTYISCMGGIVSWFVPERSDGYGLTKTVIEELEDMGIELLLTVDNGISAVEEIAFAKEQGINVVVTDHHQPGEQLPVADAIVDPHRVDCESPFKDLCGAGVVLKLMAALDGGEYTAVLEQFGDMAAMATIGDLVPIRRENRLIVSRGLQYLRNTENLGISALINSAGIEKDNINARDVAFSLVPRINAAGRFGSPKEGVEILVGEDPGEVTVLATTLSDLNQYRKQAENAIFEQIEHNIRENPVILRKRVLVFSGENWHHGVIGIVASRMVEKYAKPCLIITIEGETSRGSMRGVDGFSVHQSLSFSQDLLVKYGGHMGAGGLTVLTAEIPSLEKRLEEFSKKESEAFFRKTIVVDKLLEPSDITVESVRGLSLLEPFGNGFEYPVFAVCGAKIMGIQALSQGKHSKLSVNIGDVRFSVLAFGMSPESLPVVVGEPADIVMSIEVNSFRGKEEVVGKLKDIRYSSMSASGEMLPLQQRYFSALDAYEKYKIGEGIQPALKNRMVPQRDELGMVYRSITEQGVELDQIFIRLQKLKTDINYCKLRLSVDIFEELGLIAYDPITDLVKRLKVEGKVDLETSVILRELRCENHVG